MEINNNEILRWLQKKAIKLTEDSNGIFVASVSINKYNFDLLDFDGDRINVDNLKMSTYSDLSSQQFYHHQIRIYVPELEYTFILLTVVHEVSSIYSIKLLSNIESVVIKGNSIVNLVVEVLNSVDINQMVYSMICDSKKNQKSLRFAITTTEDGYTAQCLGHSIFTEADDIPTLEENIKDAVRCHFDNLKEVEWQIHLMYVSKVDVITLT